MSTTELRNVTKATDLSLENKERYVEYSLAVQGDIDNLKAQIAMLKGKLSRLENTKHNLETQAIDFMLKNVQTVKGKAKLETATHIITVAVPHTNKVEIEDELLIPKEYIRVKEMKTVNKEKIKVDLKDGVEVPGARLVDSEPKLVLALKKDLDDAD